LGRARWARDVVHFSCADGRVARSLEFSLRDPDGYYVTISELSSLELRGLL